MTVRAWFTISALMLVALSVAVLVRFLVPPGPPEILARAGDQRLEGVLVGACWPGRSSQIRCRDGDDEPATNTIAASGRMRVVVAFPAQPEEGYIEITGDGRPDRRDWIEEFDYELDPGRYILVAHAAYPEDAHVRYRFALTVTRSGS